MGVVGSGRETLYDSMDSPVGVLSLDRCSLPADASGVVSSFAGAVSTMSIIHSGVDGSSSWIVTVAATGLSGSLSGRTYTVTSMSAESGYVDFTAMKSGFADIIKRFHVAKVRQGNQGTPGTPGTDGINAPQCLGLYAYSARGTISGMIASDLAVLYSATAGERGIYAFALSTWTKQTSPTPDQVGRCFIFILDAVRQGYGVSSDYAPGTTSFETLLVNFLFALNIVASGSITGAMLQTADKRARLTANVASQDSDGLNISSGDLDAPVTGNIRALLGKTRTTEPGLKHYRYTGSAWQWISELVSFVDSGYVHSDWSATGDGGTTRGMISLIQDVSRFSAILSGLNRIAPSGTADNTDLGESTRKFRDLYLSGKVSVAGSEGDRTAGSWTEYSGINTTFTASSYVKVCEIKIKKSGTYRTKLGIMRGGDAGTVYGRIYKNGVAVGTARSTTTGAMTYFTQDIAFVTGDLIQLYGYHSGNEPSSFYLNLYTNEEGMVI